MSSKYVSDDGQAFVQAVLETHMSHARAMAWGQKLTSGPDRNNMDLVGLNAHIFMMGRSDLRDTDVVVLQDDGDIFLLCDADKTSALYTAAFQAAGCVDGSKYRTNAEGCLIVDSRGEFDE